MIWTREHDRVIAERCLGVTVEECNRTILGYEVKEIMIFRSGGALRSIDPLPFFNENIADMLFAAAAWKKACPEGMWRYFELSTPYVDGRYIAKVREGKDEKWGFGKTWDSVADTPATALAWALYKAVTENQENS